MTVGLRGRWCPLVSRPDRLPQAKRVLPGELLEFVPNLLHLCIKPASGEPFTQQGHRFKPCTANQSTQELGRGRIPQSPSPAQGALMRPRAPHPQSAIKHCSPRHRYPIVQARLPIAQLTSTTRLTRDRWSNFQSQGESAWDDIASPRRETASTASRRYTSASRRGLKTSHSPARPVPTCGTATGLPNLTC